MRTKAMGKIWLNSSAATAALMMFAQAVPAYAQEQSYSFDIPAQDLGSALKAFARASHQQVTFDTKAVRGKRAPELRGTYSAPAALGVLLAGSGLTAERGRSGLFIIRASATASSSSSSSVGDARPASQSGEPSAPESTPDIVVTGTNIRGIKPIAPVINVSHDQILAKGYPNIGEAIRELPQNFSGGNNPSVAGVGGQGVNQGRAGTSNAYTANLRGIGSGATLTLINGRRLAYDGASGAVDLSIVPLAALDHIEVATDGASAIYGSDAVAGVVNLVLRKDFDGAETSVGISGTTDGGGFAQRYSQVVGTKFQRGGVIVAYEYNAINPVKASQRSFSSATAAPYDLVPESKQHSIYASGHYELTDRLQGHVDAIYSHRMSTTTQTPNGSVGAVDEFGVTGGLDYDLGLQRTISLNVDRSGNVQTTELVPLAGGTASLSRFKSSVIAPELSLQGPLELPIIGPIRVAVGGGYRQESLEESSSPIRFRREIGYGFFEANVPVLKPGEISGLYRIDADFAVRYEHYSDFGETTNPKIGLSFYPIPSLSFKGSWGTSFRAPTLDQVNAASIVALYRGSLFGVTAPASATVLFVGGSNPNLKPERSNSLTATAEFAPTSLPGFRASVTYFSIRYNGRIAAPISNVLAALRTPLYAPFIVSNPSAALQSSYVAGASQFFNNAGAPYDPSNTAAIVLDNLQNVSSQRIQGVDAHIGYDFSTAIGEWRLAGDATWLSFQQKVLPGSASQVVAGTIFNPPKFKANASIGWQRDHLSASLSATHVSGEDDTNAVPVARVGSWTAVDAQLGYGLGHGAETRGGFGLNIFVRNIFDRAPPAIATNSTLPSGVGFDAANYSGLGRTIGMSITKKW
ncbi:MAG: hypothetical protein JWR80_580 [Bradyrhizobium sp.]|nr:hypothetical protein [Bradyrhizobium sp.]